jgi:hypothetical protein
MAAQPTTGEIISQTLKAYANVGSDVIEYDENKRFQAWVYLRDLGMLSWTMAPGWWRQGSGGSVALVANDTYGVMPADFATMDEQGQVYIQGSQFIPMRWISPDQLFFQRRTAPQTGRPREYTLHGRTTGGVPRIHVYPTAGTTYTLNVDGYTKKVPDFIDRPGAPTAASGGAGVLSGAYRWCVTYVTATGETEAGASFPAMSTTALSLSSNSASLTAVPISPCRSVTSRNVYRTVASGSVFKLSGSISDNTTTTYTDNVADGSLGATAPTVATATGTGPEQFPDDMIPSVFIKGLSIPLARAQGDLRDLKWQEEWKNDIKRFWAEFQQGANRSIVMPRFGQIKEIGSGYMDPRYFFGS